MDPSISLSALITWYVIITTGENIFNEILDHILDQVYLSSGLIRSVLTFLEIDLYMSGWGRFSKGPFLIWTSENLYRVIQSKATELVLKWVLS